MTTEKKQTARKVVETAPAKNKDVVAIVAAILMTKNITPVQAIETANYLVDKINESN